MSKLLHRIAEENLADGDEQLFLATVGRSLELIPNPKLQRSFFNKMLRKSFKLGSATVERFIVGYHGWMDDENTLGVLAREYWKQNEFQKALAIYDANAGRNIGLGDALVLTLMLESGQISRAHEFFKSLDFRSITSKKACSVYTVMINYYSKQGLAAGAMDLYIQLKLVCDPDIHAISSLAQMYCESNQAYLARSLYSLEQQQIGFRFTLDLALIFYRACIDQNLNYLEFMECIPQCTPDLIWNAKVLYHARQFALNTQCTNSRDYSQAEHGLLELFRSQLPIFPHVKRAAIVMYRLGTDVEKSNALSEI